MIPSYSQIYSQALNNTFHRSRQDKGWQELWADFRMAKIGITSFLSIKTSSNIFKEPAILSNSDRDDCFIRLRQCHKAELRVGFLVNDDADKDL